MERTYQRVRWGKEQHCCVSLHVQDKECKDGACEGALLKFVKSEKKYIIIIEVVIPLHSHHQIIVQLTIVLSCCDATVSNAHPLLIQFFVVQLLNIPNAGLIQVSHLTWQDGWKLFTTEPVFRQESHCIVGLANQPLARTRLAILFNCLHTLFVQLENSLTCKVGLTIEQMNLLRLGVVETTVAISYIIICACHEIVLAIFYFLVFHPIAVVGE